MKIKASKILAVVCVIAMVMTMIVPMSLTAAAAEITASKTVAELITEYGWTSNTTKQTFKLDDNVTVKINGGSNTGKAYNGDHIRIYATDTPAGTITISVPDGYELSSIKISTQTGTYAYLYVNGTTTDISNQTVAVSGNSVVLNSVKNGTNGKQVRVTALEVKYTTPDSGDCDHANTTVLAAVPATCTETGLTEGVKCADCGVIVTPQESTAKLPHNFVDDVCTCGEIKEGTTLTIEQAIALGEAKAHNEYTENKCYVSGVITEIYNTQYGNMYITDADGNVLTIYGTYSADGSDKFDAMETKPVVGDTVIIYGILGQYNGTAQIKNGWIIEIIQNESSADIREALDEVQAYMSVAYKYVARTEIVEGTVTVTDTLNLSTTGVTGTNYTDWSGKSVTSSAVYAGQSAGDKSSIQLRSNNSNSGVITTVSGGFARKITVTWHADTAAERTLDVYGSNTPYTSPTELYNATTQGTKLGSIVKGTSTELVIEGDYQYIAFRSKSGAMYLEEVQIDWESGSAARGTQEVEKLSDSQFVLKCGVDASLANIEGIASYGIAVTANGKTVCYTDEANSWAVGNDVISVAINLGDIINNKARLNTEFTVSAFVEVEGVKYYSTLEKTYSVASMVAEYNSKPIPEVAHLYGVLSGYGLV